MQTLSILSDWTGYLNRKPDIVRGNCQGILRELRRLYHIRDNFNLIGRGYSGAQLVTALQMVNESYFDFNSVIIPKGESTSINNRLTITPSIVIDDDIARGQTLSEIAHWMSYQGVKSQVEVVIGIERRRGYDVAPLIEKCFPNCKLWIR